MGVCPCGNVGLTLYAQGLVVLEGHRHGPVPETHRKKSLGKVCGCPASLHRADTGSPNFCAQDSPTG